MSIQSIGIAAVVACFLPSAYFASTAIFAVVNFGAFASELPQFLRYVAAPGVISIALAVCAFKLPGTTALTVGSSLTSILIGLFAYETVMTSQVLGMLIGRYESNSIASSSAVAPTGLLPGDSVKRLNADIGVMTLSEALLGGVPNSAVTLCRKGDRAINYTADKFGFNNPESAYANALDVMVVGDSFVEGMCQETGQDIVSQLRNKAPRSVSLGTRGAGPLFELAVIGRFGKTLKPKHVVMVFFEGNDWENLNSEMRLPWLQNAMSPGADFGDATVSPELTAMALAQIAQTKPDRVAFEDVLFRTSFVRNFFALNQTATQLGLAYPKTSPEIPAYSMVLARARALTESWGGKLDLVYIPDRARFVGVLPKDFVFDQLRERVLLAAGANGIGVIDLADLFNQQPDPLSFYAVDAHFSEKGAAFLAEKISTLLAKDQS